MVSNPIHAEFEAKTVEGSKHRFFQSWLQFWLHLSSFHNIVYRIHHVLQTFYLKHILQIVLETQNYSLVHRSRFHYFWAVMYLKVITNKNVNDADGIYFSFCQLWQREIFIYEKYCSNKSWMEELLSKYLFCHSDASISVIDRNFSHNSYNSFSTP